MKEEEVSKIETVIALVEKIHFNLSEIKHQVTFIDLLKTKLRIANES